MRLVDIMERLLTPDGCPWDREQTLATLRPYLVEETYEVLDALVRDDVDDHREELGDLLMQIVFQAALRQRAGAFDIDDVIAAISDKLVRRHPHVFGDATGVDTADKVLAQWDDIKRAEKRDKRDKRDKREQRDPRERDASAAGDGSAAPALREPRTLDGVPPGPALVRAQQLGKRCGKIGFDWPGWAGSFAKVEEEVAEIAAAIRTNDAQQVHAELGDLLLAVVNLARKLDVDAEIALVDATARFQRRFEFVEDRLAERDKTPRESTLDEMDALWTEAKRHERS